MKAKKILSFFLAFAMIFSTLNIGVFAENAVAKIGDNTYATLAKAITAATDMSGEVIVDILGTIDEDIIIHQTEGVSITIRGNATAVFTGYIEVYGHTRNKGAETLTFDGVLFKTSEKDHVFIEQTCQTSTSESADKCYPHNITVQNCSFEATDDAVNTAVGMKFRYGYNISVKKTTSTDLHSLMQNFAGQGLTVEEVEITGKNGIALGTSQNVTVNNTKITATGNGGYGLRMDAGNATTTTIENVKASAFIPVLLRKAAAGMPDYNITINGTNTLTAKNDDNCAIAVVKTDYDTESNTELVAAESVATVTINDTSLSKDVVYGATWYCAYINNVGYATLKDAITAANAMTGDVTVEIYGKTEYTADTADLTGAYDSISFVGKTDDAEISITRDSSGGYISGSNQGNDCAVSFTDLILSKPTGAYAGDAGFMNVYFTVYRVGKVSYTNCTFPDGACAQGCPVTYTECEFANEASGEYSLWVYANTVTTVTDCKFTGVRGAKMYGEGAAKTGNLVMSGTIFADSVTQKPAIVLTYGESVTLKDNTYPAKGVFELDKDGAPDGTTVTSDKPEEITCSDGAVKCGVLVNNKIYTTITDAAAVAESGDTVTLLADTEVEAELAVGVKLNTNSKEAPNVKVKAPDLEIKTADDLIKFAKDVNENKNEYSGKVVVLANDINLNNEQWTPIGANGDSTPKFRGTFDGQGNTISNLYIKQDAAYHAAGLFGATNGTIKNLTIDGANVESLSSAGPQGTVNGTAVVAGSTAYGATIDNVHVKNATVKGNRYVAGIVGYMDGSVTNCSVENVTIVATPDDLTGSYDNGDKVGGIVGYCNSNAVEISGCELKGDVSITAYRDVAGIVGYASTGVSVKSNTNSAALTVTVDQKTNHYGEKTANAGEFVGNTPVENTGNTRSDEASYTSVVINKVEGLSGAGTKEKPYLINNLSELIWFRDDVNRFAQDGSSQYTNKYVKLNADIDLAGINWEPIGSTTADHGSFYGTFDGDGHTISNLYVNKEGTGAGFFAKTSGGGDGPKAVVKNVTFNNVDVYTNDSYSGGVIANAGGNTHIENVHVTGYVYVEGYGYVGGIVGHGYPDMYNSSVDANDGSYIKANYWCAGALIGYAGEGGTIVEDSSVAGISIWSASGGAGAAVGLLQYNNKLENITAKDVEITSNSDYCMGYIAGNGEESTLTDVTMENVTASANGKPISSTDAVASINGKIFTSIADAVAAGDGKIVTLLTDADEIIDTADKTVYIDPNGFDISKGFKSDDVTVTFDETAIEALDTQAEDKGFAVKVNDITSVSEAINGSAPALALNIDVKTSDGTAIFTKATSDTNGTATVTVPYTKAKEEHTLHVYYVAEDGTATEVEGAKYENATLSFDANHFSTYAVVEGISKQYNIAAAARVNLANNDKFYNAGERIYVDFTISSTEIDTLGSFQFNFKYDATKLTLLDIESELGNAEGALSTDKAKCRVSFDVDGDKGALSITGGKVVATAVFEVKDDVEGETGIAIDETKTLEVTPLGYDKNEAKPTVQNETVNLSNITVTFKPGDNATFASGETEITAHVNYKVPGFVEAGFSVPADKLVAKDGYRMKRDITNGEELWMDENGNVYTSEALKTTAFEKNVTLTAQVVAICDVTLVAGENGHLEGVTSFVVDAGASLTAADIAKVTSVADPGYEFKEWTPAIDAVITADTIITASFDHASYTISTASVDSSVATVSGIADGDTIKHGTDVVFTVTPVNDNVTEVGYIVDGVKMPLEKSADGSYTIPGDKIVGNVDVYVLTVDMFTVTFAAGENGEVSGTTTFIVNKSENLTAEDLAMVTPAADAGYRFVGYSLDGKMVSENDILNKEIYDNITITALFDHDTFKLTDVNKIPVDVTHGTDYTFTPVVEGKIVTNVTAAYKNDGDVVIEKNDDGSYTIPGNEIIDDITLTAETVDGKIRFILNRDYKALKGRQSDADEKIAVLDTAKLSGEKYVLENGAQFYWSGKYNAYVYIVAGLTEGEGVTAAMLAAALQKASGDAKEIVYDGDMNGDGAITVSDAMIITDILHQKRQVSTSILQRLRADVTGSGEYVSTADVDKVRIDAQNQ